MNFGHAIKRALAEVGKALAEILAAEDPALEQRGIDLRHGFAGPVEIDDEFLEEALALRHAYAADLGQALRA